MSADALSALSPEDADVRVLLDHYERWREAYGCAGCTPRDAPDWEGGKLYFRQGYPYPDWSAFAITRNVDGDVLLLNLSTERRNTPSESVDKVFSDVEVAGKYVLYAIGDYLRIQRRLDPVSWQFRDWGMSAQVEKLPVDDRRAKYRLRADHAKYFITGGRGVSWTNWLLTMSYEALNRTLAEGLPGAAVDALFLT